MLCEVPAHPHCAAAAAAAVCRGQAPEWLHGSVVEHQPPPWCRLSVVQESDSSLAHTELLSAKSWCLLFLLWLQAVTAGIFYIRAE